MKGYQVIFFVVVGMLMGNVAGDRATLRDCAVKGTAEMSGGGTIKCEIVKEVKETTK